jgi:ATP-dependent exoDNAse (exonuclease V) alpha subunit
VAAVVAAASVIAFAGRGIPLRLDSWSGDVAPVAQYTGGRGRVTIDSGDDRPASRHCGRARTRRARSSGPAAGVAKCLTHRRDRAADNRRQQQAWEHEALDDLREGRADVALAQYERHGRVVVGEGAEDVRRRLVEDWWEATAEGEVAMIALRRTDVADLNDRARALMRAHGRLGPDTLRVGDRDFAVGDHVVALKNARQHDIVNGTRGVVTGFDQVTGALALRTSDGRDLELPRSYLESQTERGSPTLDHGYAITGHKAQGMTTDNAFVLGTDELYRLED